MKINEELAKLLNCSLDNWKITHGWTDSAIVCGLDCNLTDLGEVFGRYRPCIFRLKNRDLIEEERNCDCPYSVEEVYKNSMKIREIYDHLKESEW